MWDDLLRIARLQEAVDQQLKQYVTDQVNNQLTDQVNAVGDKLDGSMRSGKGKKWFSCNQGGHFNTGCRADFVVVKGDGRMLLGCETVEILNLLHIGPFQVNNVDSGRLESCVREKYKALFTGVGLLKRYELKLHIDDSVKPVAQPVRRIPFGLREKLDKKHD